MTRHPVETIWRNVGLPEYFLGNDGSNHGLYRLHDRIQWETVSSIVDMWPELCPRPVTRAEGELLNAVLMNMLSRLRERGVEVPDVAIVRVENVEVRE